MSEKRLNERASTLTVELLLRRLYETERRLDERNSAKGHSYGEWKQQQLGEERRDAGI
jgi:hypothetical protein